MGFEPTTLRSLERPTRSRRVVGSNPIWNSDFFPSLLDAKTSCCISIKASLGGWMVASLICLNVTARCSYESCVCLICLNVTA